MEQLAPVQKPRGRPKTLNKVRLIEIAEGLFASKGIDAVSLREIALAAGYGDNNAVQANFGSKIGLLNAIYTHRIKQMDGARGALLARVREGDRSEETLDLLAALCLPHLSIPDAHGTHPYASFLVQFAIRYWPRASSEWTPAAHIAPNLALLIARLVGQARHIPQDLARTRVTMCNLMFANVLVQWDQTPERERSPTLETRLADTLASARDALLAPAADPALLNIVTASIRAVETGTE